MHNIRPSLGYNGLMIKRIFYYAISLVGFLFVAGTKIAQAVSLPDFSKTSDLPAFISSVYSFALTVVGIAIFIRILYAGFLMLTAAGNSSKWGDARAKMQNAVVGAILLFSAYLILYVINPDLVKNTFKFTIPSSTSTAPTTASVKTNTTGGPVAVSGIIPAAGGVTSFRGLPIARAQEGVYSFTIKVTDRNGDTCRQTYNIEVVPLTAAVNADFYAKHSAAGKYSAALLNAVNAQEENGNDIIRTIQSGGCVINTKILPNAIEGIPYYAEIFVAGEAPFVYEIEDGYLPGGLSIVAAFDMPILTIKNLTAQRTPIYAFKVGDTFRLDLTNAKPNSDVYFKWFKDGTKWHYPSTTPNSEGWAKYGVTDGNGDWTNQAAFTTNDIGTWQEYAMVNGMVSRVIEFQVLAPEIKIIVSAPAPGTGTPVYYGGGYGGGGGGSGCQMESFCENKRTGARTEKLTDEEAQAQSIAIGSSDRCPGMRQVSTCTYSQESSQQSECDANQFDSRNCYDELNARKNEDGTINTTGLTYSKDGSPPANVGAGSLYTVDQMSGSVRLGSTNVQCRYSDQAAAVYCGNSMSGEYCSSGNAGFNTTWCAGQVDASGKPINPPAATPIPGGRGGTGQEEGRGGSRSR